MSDAGNGPAANTPDPLRILLEASQVAAEHSLELDDLLEALGALIRKVVDYQLFAILLADEKEELAIRYSIGYRPELVRTLRVETGQGITGHAAEDRGTIVANDVRHDQRYLMALDAVRSEMSVPLVARGKLVGVIDLQSAQLNAFGDRERELVELIGSRFSLAIDAAQLYEATVRTNQTLRVLDELSRDFSNILELEELLESVAGVVRRLMPYDAFSIYLLEEDSQTLKHYFGARFDERVQWSSMDIGQGLVGYAAKERQSVLVRDTDDDKRYISAVEGIRSEVAAPLILKDRVIGVVDLESERVAAFTQEHEQTLTLLAPQIASAIVNARLYEKVAESERRLKDDLAAARRLQRHLLPERCPTVEGLEIAAKNFPATAVSGDLYDFYKYREGGVAIINGDVSGKGAAAALYAALASGLLRNAARKHRGPIEFLLAANRALMANHIESRYLAAMFAVWAPGRREIVVASAGEPPPVVRRAGVVEALEIGGMPLGLFESPQFEELTVKLEPGDVFVMASDGLHETENAAGEQYGDLALAQTIERLPDATAEQLLKAILDDATAFGGGGELFDDRTVIVLRAKL